VEIRLFSGQGPKLSTPTRIPLVGPLLLATPPVVICLCIVLRYFARVQMTTPVGVVLGRVLLGMVHTVADAIPWVQGKFPRDGGFLFLRAVNLMIAV